MVELTACTHQDPIPEEYEDVHVASHYQGWGVFGVKHVTVKRRGQQRDQEGNTIQHAWHYIFLFKESG